MTTTVMLKDKEAELLEQARKELFFRGLGSLDESLQEEIEKKLELESISTLTKGAVIAIAALILINALDEGNKR